MRSIFRMMVVIALATGSISSMAGVAVAAPPAGSISGIVCEADGTTPIPTSAHVFAYDWSSGSLMGTAYSSGYDGGYTISGLGSGEYRVRARSNGYSSEYCNDVADFDDATAVMVTDPNETSGIDFALARCGSISGTVYADDNVTPVYSGHIMLFDSVNHDEMVDETWMRSGHCDYRVGKDLPTGSYHVRVEALGYFSEYYDNVTDINDATAVGVTVPDETSGIDFRLTPGGIISGTIISDTGAPVYGAHVTAYDNVTHAEVDEVFLGSTVNTYKLGRDMDTGGYRVLVQATGYFDEYYNNATAIASAATVVVTAPDETPNINFSLNDLDVHVSAVSATAGTGGTTATITWTTDQPADSQVDCGLTESYGSTVQDATPVTSHSVNLTLLTSETTYHYMVSSTDSYDSDSSADLTFTTFDITAPVVSEVTATSITANGATITWTTNEPANSQVKYGLTTGYGSSTTLDTNPLTSHSANVTGLNSQTVHHYQVTSIDGSGNPATSADYTFTTLDITAPVISAVTATNVTAAGATITWTTDEAASSLVEYGLTTSYGSSTTLDSNLVTSHSVNLTGLTSQTTYHYRVKSIDGSSNPASSADYTFATPDVTGPVISAVSATSIAGTSATITWTTDEAANSQVEYGLTTSYGSTTTLDSNLVTGHSVNLTGLSSFKTYHYTVKSFDAAGNTTSSADYSFTTTDATVPTTPVVSDDGESTTDLTQLRASWTSTDADSGITEYQYAIGTTSGGTDVVSWTSVGADNAVTKSGLDLSAGTNYYFTVKAKNGQGLWSVVGTSDGIVAEEETTSGEGGGMPAWAWVLIGLAAVGVVGGAAYFIRGRMAQG